MITAGYFPQIFIFNASHQARTENCGKFIFHVDLQRKKLIKCSTTLVVAGPRMAGQTQQHHHHRMSDVHSGMGLISKRLIPSQG
jgi:hypothetical protein